MSLKKRLPTAFVLIILVYFAVEFLPLIGFFLVLQLVILLSLFEFYNLISKKNFSPQILMGFIFALLTGLSFYTEKINIMIVIYLFIFTLSIYFLIWTNKEERVNIFPSSFALTFFGVFFVSFALNYLFLINKISSKHVLFLLTVVYVGDTGAYIFGKLWGRKKMVPIASPNKTWMGALGGVIFAVIGAILGKAIFLKKILFLQAIICSLFLSIISQLSDPVESLFKRAVKVKDSSSILPGHGGVLDRIDSLILSAPFFYYYIQLIWKK